MIIITATPVSISGSMRRSPDNGMWTRIIRAGQYPIKKYMGYGGRSICRLQV
jgi:hypothetical protein